jgi:hypothetical protein
VPINLEETNMNMTKRLLLITTMSVLIIAAFAVVPAYKRSALRVRAARPTPAVVVLACDVSEGILTAYSSDASVTLPASGTDCATSLQGVVSQSFSITGSAFSLSGRAAGGWTLVRSPEHE